ncbi:MAG TPA: cyclic nucleotide-binding domain-containing protein [Solirubrobacteraceae bacterium]|nr:cyclic nucleotide-binding domain-containing protein [Solirubrobacteraceae bacterium]
MRLFGPIRPMEARSLAGPVVDVEVAPGTELVHEGTVIGTFFVIRSGTAVLLQGDYAVGALLDGECFGEIDPLSPEPQRYTVIAGSRLRLMTFSSFGITRLCDAMPGARQRLEDALPHGGAEIHPLPRTPVPTATGAPVGAGAV